MSNMTPHSKNITEMLSKMRTLLIDVMVETSLPDASRIKLKDCISMVETFSNFLNNNFKKEEDNSENFRKPLHSGLSRSTECLNVKTNKLSGSRSTSDLAKLDLYDNDEDDQVDLNTLKENYLEAVNEFNNNPEINGEVNTTEINNTKPEVKYDKPETNQSKPDVNSTKTDLINSSTEQNYNKPNMNGIKPEINETKPEVNGATTEVVRRDGKGSKPRRKRDSSTLFDISLDDLTEPDHSGFLTEKHSGKEWWCVLQDQHLCMFPSQNSQELAYDVLLVPCCEISLDDVYTESPVFRLTQVGSTPWVFSAGIERNLRAWIRALYRACGRDDADWRMRSSKKGRGRKDKKQKRNMKVFTSTIDESEEVEETGEDVGQEVEMKVDEEKESVGGMHGKENGKNCGDKNGTKGEPEGFVLEEKGKEDAMKEEVMRLETGHENGLKMEEEKERKEMGQDVGQEDETKTEEQIREGSGIEKKENKEIKNHDGEKNMEEIGLKKGAGLNNQVEGLMGKVDENQKSEKREEEAQSEYTPEVNKQGNKNENFSQTEKDKQQDKVSKALKESESQELNEENFRDEKCLGKQGNTNENGNQATCSPNITFDDDHNDYVIRLQSAEETSGLQTECSENVKSLSMERKATKKRIKMLRWLKKAIVDKGQDDATVIGDIYKIEGPNRHVKLWCLLRDRQLYCYQRVSDTTPDSVIPLDNCVAVPSAAIPGKKFAFDIEKEGVKLATFAARSSKERARWIDIVKTKRGSIRLREFSDESGEEAGGSGTSEEEDESHEYVEVNNHKPRTELVNNHKPRTEFKTEGEYVLPMSEDVVYEDAGYISVLALESEVDRRKTSKKDRKYHPNITSKCGIEHLIKKDTPLFMSTIPRESPRKNRSPAPLPRDSALFSGKNQAEISKGVPAIHVDSGVEKMPGNESDKVLEINKDLNNNTDVESLEKVTFSGECPDDEELSSHEEGIFHCQLTASSWLPDSPPCQARFGPRREDTTGAWRPEMNDKTQFLEIDLGDLMTVGAIGVKGRPDFDGKGGEFIKSFTVHHSIDKETWTPYKSHGKIKIFQGISSVNQECKKYFKNKTIAQYFRIYPQSWQNHIALQVALYKEDIKSKGMKKNGDKLMPTSPIENRPVSPTKKAQLKKEDISDPMYPSSDCLLTEVTDPADIIENGRKSPNSVEPQTPLDCSDNPASMESRIKLREKLLSKEKREQITKLEVLTKHVNQAKDRIIVNTSGQLTREAIESEHDYLVANLELVKAKKRLIDIETEMRELRLFGEKYGGENQEVREVELPKEITRPTKPRETYSGENQEVQEVREVEIPKEIARPTKPPLKRRPSKEVMVCTDVVSPVVDREGFNSPGDPPPPRKVMDNVKLFEKFHKQP